MIPLKDTSSVFTPLFLHSTVLHQQQYCALHFNMSCHVKISIIALCEISCNIGTSTNNLKGAVDYYWDEMELITQHEILMVGL